MRYKVCKWCGANLDPGEKCECEEQEFMKQLQIDRYLQRHFEETITGQLMIIGAESYGE